MKSVSISWIRNEADIIETFVRYHAAMIDKMVIIDHRSKDDTVEILNKLKKEGFDLDIRHNHSHRHQQKEAITKLVNEFAAKSEWLIPLDADEFLVTKFNFRHLLDSLKTDKIHFINWYNYCLTGQEDFNELNILKKIQHRAEEVHHNQHKCIIHKKFAEVGYVKEGCHELYSKRTNEAFSYQYLNSIHIAHFPVRSFQQIYQKAFSGWLSQLSNHTSSPGKELPERTHWKQIYDMLASPNDVDLKEITSLYAGEDFNLILDPVIGNFEIKYPSQFKISRLQALASAAEDAAKFLQKSNRIIKKLR